MAELKTTLLELTYQFAEYFTAKDESRLADLLDDHFALYDPALKWVRGKDKAMQVFSEGFKTFQHIEYKAIETFQDKDVTIMRFEITMDEHQYIGVDIIRWENQKIKELICYYNPPK